MNISSSKDNPIVSIIVITYNQEPYIRQALDSILQQDFSGSMEILIGDDASDDQTPAIIREYSRKYPLLIHPVFRDKNIGASRNIYHLLSHASGKYIALLEGDDFWLDKEKLKIQIDFLEKNHVYIGCTHDCLMIETDGSKSKKQKKLWICDKQHFCLNDCKGFYLSGQTGTLVFRNIFKEPQHDYSIIYKAHPLISDRTIQTILTALGPIRHIDRTMSVYRQNISPNGKNATAVLFVNNQNSPYENFRMTLALENYMKQTFDRKLPCESIKHMFFSVALAKALTKPTRRNWQVVSDILSDTQARPFQYLICFPFTAFKRLFLRFKEGL